VIGAVLDANAFASGALRYNVLTSPPAAILRAWLRGSFELITSDPMVAEIERTLAQPYFSSRISRELHHELLTELQSTATRTVLSVWVSSVATHPEDDLVLATAVSANADYLVTGDKPLQQLRQYQSVPIISPRAFLTLLEEADQQR
jgi:putative PIN family toxin of toxin-antitoxin system